MQQIIYTIVLVIIARAVTKVRLIIIIVS